MGLIFTFLSQEKSPKMLKKESGFEPEPYYLQKEWMYNTPGYELNKFTNHYYMGLGTTVVGGGLTGLGIYLIGESKNIVSQPYYNYTLINGEYVKQIAGYTNKQVIDKGKESLGAVCTILGGAISLAGIYFTLEAPIHAKRAALIMNQNGVGIKIKLNQNYENQNE